MPLLYLATVSSILSEILVVIGIIIVVFLIFRIGRFLLKVIFGLIINAILGFVAIFLINFLFKLGIPFTLPIIAATAVFGLPAVGTMIIFKISGMSLMLV